MQVGRVRPGAPPEHDVLHPVGGGLGQARPTNNIGIHGPLLAESNSGCSTRSFGICIPSRMRSHLSSLVFLVVFGLASGCSIEFSAQFGAPTRPVGTSKSTSPPSAAPDKPAPAAGKGAEDKAKKGKAIADVVGKDKKFEGLFTLYQNTTNGSTHLVVKKSQLDKEFIYFTHTVDGVPSAGHFRGAFRDNRVFSFRKQFNRIEIISENTAFYFSPTNALKRAASANISPAILASQEILAEDEEKGEMLLKADGLFLSEVFHPVKSLGRGSALGSLSREKTKYLRLRSYPKNTDVVVEYVYENPNAGGPSGPDVTDARFVSIRMQHSLIEMPENDYQPRFDDPRVGYFATQVTDLTSPSATPYRDVIHRWHLVKKDKQAALSEPVEPIVWWIENTTPMELRETIKQATLEWNEAFEAAGFKNAVVVKIQPDDADWDAGDIRYNVLRWTSSPDPPFGGYGPSFVNPRTGQILGADIMLEYVYLANRIRMERLFSEAGLELTPALSGQQLPGAHFCALGHHLHHSALFGQNVLKASGASAQDIGQLLKESIYYLILHEVGHTLGLNHNMRSSQMLSPAQLQDKELTRRQGLTGSVMDYPAANLAPPGAKQGEYFTTKAGPYDRWAIEFGYAPSLSDAAAEQQRMQKLLARSTEPALAFGNDADDMRAPGKAIDPRVMINDLSSDAIGYAQDRIRLAKETMTKLRAKFSDPGQSHHALRTAYLSLTTEIANAAATISRYIGGVQVDRAYTGQPGASRPFTPVSGEEQKRALKVLREQLFAPSAFDAPEDLINHLQMQRRGFDFRSSGEDPKIHERALTIQRAVLDHLLHPDVLARLTNARLYGNRYTTVEFLEDLTQAIFQDDLDGEVRPFRQNLQVEYTSRIARAVGRDGFSGYDSPARSASLAQLRRIESLLKGRNAAGAETKAHTDHVLHLIERALNPD